MVCDPDSECFLGRDDRLSRNQLEALADKFDFSLRSLCVSRCNRILGIEVPKNIILSASLSTFTVDVSEKHMPRPG